MKHTILLAVLFLMPPTMRAQNWCPPDAQWHWTIFALGTDGYVHRWYSGDTVLGGRTAQRIEEEGILINYFSQDTSILGPVHYTAVDNEDVLLWVEYDGIWQWDTLYRFGADPGTMWRPAGLYGTPFCVVQVNNATTIDLDGVPLRQLTLTYLDEDSVPSGMQTIITERLGGEWGMWHLAYQCVMDAGAEMLRCYSDLQIDHVEPDWDYGCDSWLASEEVVSAPGRDLLFPNPGSDQITIVPPIPGTPFTWTLLDVWGRVVLSGALSSSMDVPVRQLPPGAYAWQMSDRQGALAGYGRWVKE